MARSLEKKGHTEVDINGFLGKAREVNRIRIGIDSSEHD
jgi:hypothetical protein